jgi:hypothetical protein
MGEYEYVTIILRFKYKFVLLPVRPFFLLQNLSLFEILLGLYQRPFVEHSIKYKSVLFQAVRTVLYFID